MKYVWNSGVSKVLAARGGLQFAARVSPQFSPRVSP